MWDGAVGESNWVKVSWRSYENHSILLLLRDSICVLAPRLFVDSDSWILEKNVESAGWVQFEVQQSVDVSLRPKKPLILGTIEHAPSIRRTNLQDNK